MSAQTPALIALGANLSDRARTLDMAIDRLRAADGVRVVAVSHWHRTAPIGGPPGQGEFLNGATLVETGLPPDELLELLQGIETELGRRRPTEHWSARTIDLDLLLYGDRVIDTPAMTIPHPAMAFRRFVLEPAAEVAPDLVHPQIGWSLARLLAHLDSADFYVTIAGPNATARRDLAKHLHAEHGGMLLTAEDVPPTERHSADPSGRRPAAGLEFFDACVLALDRSRRIAGGWNPRTLLVSDYWFDQLRIEADRLLTPADAARFAAVWQAAASQVVRPKLLIVLNDAVPKHSESASHNRELNKELDRLIAQGGHGPVLMLDASQTEAARRHASAAIAATE